MPKEGDGNPQTQSLGFLIFRINRAMYAEFSRRLASLGVSGAEWTIMSQLSIGSTTPAALAHYMQIDRAAVTRFLQGLHRKRLIRRKRNPGDKRSTLVELTPAGREKFAKLVAASKATNEVFKTIIGEAEFNALVAGLQRFAAKLPQKRYSVRECV